MARNKPAGRPRPQPETRFTLIVENPVTLGDRTTGPGGVAVAPDDTAQRGQAELTRMVELALVLKETPRGTQLVIDGIRDAITLKPILREAEHPHPSTVMAAAALYQWHHGNHKVFVEYRVTQDLGPNDPFATTRPDYYEDEIDPIADPDAQLNDGNENTITSPLDDDDGNDADNNNENEDDDCGCDDHEPF